MAEWWFETLFTVLFCSWIYNLEVLLLELRKKAKEKCKCILSSSLFEEYFLDARQPVQCFHLHQSSDTFEGL